MKTEKDIERVTVELSVTKEEGERKGNELDEAKRNLEEKTTELETVSKKLLKTEQWLQKVLLDNEEKGRLITDLVEEQERLELKCKQGGLEWLEKKLELLRQLGEAREEMARGEQENSTLRHLIRRELKMNVQILGPPDFERRIRKYSSGVVNPAVVDEKSWQWVEQDTIFVWGADGPGKAGEIAFAVVFQPPELMARQTVFLSLFDHIREFRYPLKRHSIKEGGKVWGIGFRAGYDAGVSFGQYATPRQRSQHPENRRIEEVGGEIAAMLEGVLHRRLPTEFEEKEEIVAANEVPTVAGSKSTPHTLPTEDYWVTDHFDTDLACADGVWLEQHGKNCKRAKKGESCCRRWAFLFPEYNVAVPITHGTCIVWQGLKVRHLTVLQKRKDACADHKALSVVTQIKKSLVDRVKASKRRRR